MRFSIVRKKPVAVEALQLTTENYYALKKIVNNKQEELTEDDWNGTNKDVPYGLYVPTLEDDKEGHVKHYALIGDWIIRGINGEYYPCKPDIFDRTYDIISEGE